MGRKATKEALEHVDLVNGTLYNSLKQIRVDCKGDNGDLPILVSVWCCQIDTKQTQKLASLIRDYINPYDDVSLTHLKRFSREEGKAMKLKSIICSTEFLETKEDVCEFIKEYSDIQIETMHELNVPRFPPPTREISQKWSSAYWPVSWKGNPNHQFLNSVEIDIEYVRNLIHSLKEIEKESNSILASIFVNQENKIQCTTKCYSHNDPFQHSIMQGIEQVSLEEQKKRKDLSTSKQDRSNYLCQNMTVFSSHEPCVMCCMALVHSRISRLIYLRSSPSSGGLETNYQLGDREGLNWKFEIWKWIDRKSESNVASSDELLSNPINY